MIKIYLCDDSKKVLEKYLQIITNIAEKNNIDINMLTFHSGEALLFHLEDEPNDADIIYLDIIMEKLNGMETAKRLRSAGCKAEIIFLTYSDDYIFEAFDVGAVQYIIKEGVTVEKFEEVFLRAVSLVDKKEKEMFAFEFGNVKKVVPIQDISYFDIWKRVVTVHFGTETSKFYGSMEQLENQFSSKGFARVHRSYMVNLSYIYQFKSHNIVLRTGEIIPVGVTYMKPLQKTFSDYISKTQVAE